MDNATKLKQMAFIGRICRDNRWTSKMALKVGKKQRGTGYDESCGGPAAIAAAVAGHFIKQTIKTKKPIFIGAIGDDYSGMFVTDQLNKYGVNTDFVTKCKGVKTSNSAVLVSTDDGERTIEGYQDSRLVIGDINNLEASVIEFDGQDLKASLEAIRLNPNAITILDAGRATDDVIELAKRVNYVICSEDFAEDYVKKVTNRKKFKLNSSEAISYAYKIMQRDFLNDIVITLGKNGCVYKNNDDIILVPSSDDKAIDSTGAGDIFHGAFTYAIASDFEKHDALIFAMVVSGLSVTKIGGITSIPDTDEVNQAWFIYNDNPNKESTYLYTKIKEKRKNRG